MHEMSELSTRKSLNSAILLGDGSKWFIASFGFIWQTRMAPQTVTTGEAAERLGVAPATIQRWVNAGLVIAERTMGGHRRIPIAEVRRLLASSRPASLPGSAAQFLDVLLSGRPHEIKAALFAIRQ